MFVSCDSPVAPFNNYTVTSGNINCVVLSAGFKLTLPYPGDKQNFTSTVIIPSGAFTNGTCGTMNDVLNIFFNDTWSMTLTFTNSSPSTYSLDTVTLNFVYTTAWFPNISASLVTSKAKVSTNLPEGTYQAPSTGSYRCKGERTLALNDSITLVVTDLQYRAFGNTNSTGFTDTDIQDCQLASAKPDVNPATAVTVGIALAVTLVVVVALYFIFVKIRGHYRDDLDET